MHFYSTNKISPNVTLEEAVIKGLAADNGLYMPEKITPLPAKFFKEIGSLSLQQIAFEVAKTLLQNSIDETVLKKIIEDSINFDAPLVSLNDSIQVLELFHGPTAAFKDFGARFMARITAHFIQKYDKKVNVLVATSGDTGSAVANGFLNMPNTRVIILYPKKKVSFIQEQQLTTLGNNIIALEVDAVFDDCQNLVKQAFLDEELNKRLILTSANSINIARLIPQSFYYFYAYAQLKDKSKPVVFSVPSGNFGNLTAGLMAQKMGLPVSMFIAATNINDIVPEYLKSGIFEARPSESTISNSMDVGNPSNFRRMLDLYNNDLDTMRKHVKGYSFTDDQTKMAMKEVSTKFNYTIDPHGAVAYLGLDAYLKEKGMKDLNGIVLETAHPSKFIDVVESTINKQVKIPERLEEYMSKKNSSKPMSNSFDDFKKFLLELD
jgi:threonine synthase